ncbi:cysteine/glutathione ABC transporter ATP-binding protein/permease CydC|nr:cysteine/glutathione ABC transporter ATP-binding protein/permease CydC [Candidatus Pantoea persica]
MSHDATFRVLQHLRVFTFSRLIVLAPGQLAAFRQGDLLNRFVGDVDTLNHLYLRVIAPLVGAFVVILVVTLGIGLVDSQLALVLGCVMLAALALMPPLFYRLGRLPDSLSRKSARWRLQLIHWLNGQAVLAIYGLAERWREQLDHDEHSWQAASACAAGAGGLACPWGADCAGGVWCTSCFQSAGSGRRCLSVRQAGLA